MIDRAVDIFIRAKETGAIAVEDYNRAIKAIKHAKVETTIDYILQKYNLCILNELSPEPSKPVFEKALADLNAVLSLRKHEYAFSLLSLYDKVAALNFRSHKYKEAMSFLNCAMAIEKKNRHGTYKLKELQDQFMRRWRLALCLEYSGLNELEKHEKGNSGKSYIEQAIALLVGPAILSTVQNDEDENDEKKQEKATDTLIQLQQSTNSPLFFIASPEDEIVKISGTEFSEPCLARTLEKWGKDNSFSDDPDSYSQLVAETEHILSHCLSEYINYCTSKEKSISAINLVRLSDILMHRLGDDYITCVATLAIERKEYYKAIDMLAQKRKEIRDILDNTVNQTNSSHDALDVIFSDQIPSLANQAELKKKAEQLALIDFYIWYFSVLAGKTDYAKVKEEFNQYCKLSNDLNAKTYYSVINLKELLINGFIHFSGSKEKPDTPDNQKYIDQIRQAFNLMDKTVPNYNIHFSIIQEWDFLRKAHSVFSLYVTIMKTPYNYDFRYYELAKKLYNRHDISVKSSRIRRERIVFYRAESERGSFMFKGDIKALKQIGKECFGGFTLSPYTKLPSSYKRQKWYKDDSNVLIFITDSIRDKCLSFIDDIIKTDHFRPADLQHTLFVDYSGVSDSAQLIGQIKTRTKDNIHIRYFDQRMQAFVLCALFSRIENVLFSLYKPLNSYMISPIANDVTYENQQDKDSQKLLKSTDISGLSNWTVEKAERILSACLPTIGNTTYTGKVLNLESFAKTIPNMISVIKHLFRFSVSTQEDECLMITNHFDISSHLSAGARKIFSDNIYIYDKGQALRQSLSSICVDASESKRFSHVGCSYNCITLLVGAKLEKYPALREYLFSYLGIRIENYSFVLLQQHANTSNVQYSLCVIDGIPDIFEYDKNTFGVQSLCHALQSIDNRNEFIAEVEKTKSTEEPETLQKLKNQIKPIKNNKPYIFISYRGKNGSKPLCEPVYRDVIYLQHKYSELDFYIDVANMGGSPNKDIEKFIPDPNCVGAIIYLSPEYITLYQNGQIISAEDDACYKEAKLILEQKGQIKCGHPFFVFPVFLPNTLPVSTYADSLDAKGFVEDALTQLQKKSDVRIGTFHDLLECQPNYVTPLCTILPWEQYGLHFETKDSGRGDCFQNRIKPFIKG